MGFPNIRVWPFTLADQGGVWCAECLEYIDRSAGGGDKLQDHHVLRQSFLDATFGKGFCAGWTVPAHQRCHQKKLDLVGASTHDYLDKLQYKSSQHQDADTARLHERGLYSLCLPAKTRLIQKLAADGDTDSAAKAIRHAITTGSGTRWGEALVRRCLRGQRAAGDPWIVVNLAGYAASSGNLDTATKLIEQTRVLAARMPKAARKAFDVVLWRRNSQRVSGLHRADSDTVAVGLRDSELAFEDAETWYSRKTALVIRASLLYRAGALTKAQEAVFQLMAEEPDKMPWLYKAEAYMLWGLCGLERNESPETVYRWLALAQYIFCMLGLQSHAPVGTSRVIPGSPGASMPGHILMKSPHLAVNQRLSRSRMTKIRRDAIGYPHRPGGDTVWHVIREDLACRRIT